MIISNYEPPVGVLGEAIDFANDPLLAIGVKGYALEVGGEIWISAGYDIDHTATRRKTIGTWLKDFSHKHGILCYRSLTI